MRYRVVALELTSNLEQGAAPAAFLKFIDTESETPTGGGIETVLTEDEMMQVAEVAIPVFEDILNSRLGPQNSFSPAGARLVKDNGDNDKR